MKNKTRKKIYSLIGFIAVISIIITLFYFNTEQSVQILNPDNLCYAASSGVNIGSYYCGVNECSAQGVAECNSITEGNQKVTYRGTGNFNSGSSFALALNGGNLISYVGSSVTLSTNVCSSSSNDIILTDGNGIIFYDESKNRIFVCYNGVARIFDKGGNADLSSTLNSNEVCNENHIKCEGTSSSYNCELPVRINNQLVETATSNKQGTYYTQIYKLTKGQTFNFAENINYAVIDNSKACSVSQCTTDKKGYYTCSTGACPALSEQPIMCDEGQFCYSTSSGAKCGTSFISEGEIVSSNSIGIPIRFKYSLESNSIESAIVTYTLVDISNRNNPVEVLGPFDYQLPTTKTVEFEEQNNIGNYEIIVSKTYDNKEVEDEIFPFVIGSQLQVSIFVPQSELTGTNILAGSPFYVDVQALESGVSVSGSTNFNSKASLLTIDSKTIDIPVPNGNIINTPLGDVIRYTFNVNETGRFTFTSSANKFGVVTDEKSRAVDIKSSKIVITFTNIEDLLDVPPGQYIVEFETKNPFGENIDTNHKVKIIQGTSATGLGDIDVTNTVKRDSKGKYSFTYDFPRGTYNIDISEVSAEGFNSTSSYRSGTLNVQPGSTGPSDTSTATEEGQTNRTMVIIIIIVAIILAIVFVFLTIKNKIPFLKV